MQRAALQDDVRAVDGNDFASGESLADNRGGADVVADVAAEVFSIISPTFAYQPECIHFVVRVQQ